MDEELEELIEELRWMMGSLCSCLPLWRLLCKKNIEEDDFRINADDLSEDIWIEIFFRLPLNSIYKFRLVSKSWLSILSNPVFIARYFFLRFHASPWTLFFQFYPLKGQPASKRGRPPYELSVIESIWNEGDAYFPPTRKNNRRRFLRSISNDGFSFRFLQQIQEHKQLYLLASSNGLVLCSTSLSFQMDYFVCNPLTKNWVALPSPKNIHRLEWVLHGFICESSSCSSSSSLIIDANSKVLYTVVRIGLIISRPSNSNNLHVEIFSSDKGTWRIYNVSCAQEIEKILVSTTVVTVKRVMYWISVRPNGIIAYDLKKNKNGKGTLLDLPNDDIQLGGEYHTSNECLGAFQGLLSYCKIWVGHENSTLSIWRLQVDNNDYLNGGGLLVSWHLVHKVEIRDILKENKNFTKFFQNFLCPLAFNPVDPDIVILDWYHRMTAYNIRTRRLIILRKLPYAWSEYEAPMYQRWYFRVLPFMLTPLPTTIPPPTWTCPFNFSL